MWLDHLHLIVKEFLLHEIHSTGDVLVLKHSISIHKEFLILYFSFFFLCEGNFFTTFLSIRFSTIFSAFWFKIFTVVVLGKEPVAFQSHLFVFDLESESNLVILRGATVSSIYLRSVSDLCSLEFFKFFHHYQSYISDRLAALGNDLSFRFWMRVQKEMDFKFIRRFFLFDDHLVKFGVILVVQSKIGVRIEIKIFSFAFFISISLIVLSVISTIFPVVIAPLVILFLIIFPVIPFVLFIVILLPSIITLRSLTLPSWTWISNFLLFRSLRFNWILKNSG